MPPGQKQGGAALLPGQNIGESVYNYMVADNSSPAYVRLFHIVSLFSRLSEELLLQISSIVNFNF